MPKKSQQPENSVEQGFEATEAEVSDASTINLEILELQREKARLEVEQLRATVDKMRQDQQVQRMTHEATEEALMAARQRRKLHQTRCNHRKGGLGTALLNNRPGYGISQNYAVIQHTYNSGITMRMCQRCGKEWWPGDPEYVEAMRWPTNNTPSSSALMLGFIADRSLIKRTSD